jgi:hypothetical protein
MSSKPNDISTIITKSNKKIPVKKPSLMQELMAKMNISETKTKPIHYKFPKVKNEVFPRSGYNYQGDLLMLPTTKKGFEYLLTVTDIYSHYLDFEPMKTKTAEETLKGFKRIFKRGILPKPKASLRTDNGSEFKSVVDKYMHNHNILHTWTLPDRHKQTGTIENLNRQIGRVLMTYLTNKSIELGYEYLEWTDIIDKLRHNLNDAKKHPSDIDLNTYVPKEINMDNLPLFKIGDIVYHRLEVPVDDKGIKLHDSRFRQGDIRYDLLHPRKIVQVFAYSSVNPYRYELEDMANVSYAEAELISADEELGSRYTVREILDKKTIKRKIYYRIWWSGYLKKDASWEPKSELILDGLQNRITEFEDTIKSKKK